MHARTHAHTHARLSMPRPGEIGFSSSKLSKGIYARGPLLANYVAPRACRVRVARLITLPRQREGTPRAKACISDPGATEAGSSERGKRRDEIRNSMRYVASLDRRDLPIAEIENASRTEINNNID